MDALGAYGSDSESSSSSDDDSPSHGPLCECDRCKELLKRFCIAKLATAGASFRCKLCNKGFSKKPEAHKHINVMHSEALQLFKKTKDPELFSKKSSEAKAHESKIESFAIGNVLDSMSSKKRKDMEALDERDKVFANAGPSQEMQDQIAKKQRRNDVIISPEEIAEQSKKINDIMWTRFITGNIFAVTNAVKCGLCRESFKTVEECKTHIATHTSDWAEQVSTWERYKKRQALNPTMQGDWLCITCNLRFVKPESLQHHWGDQIWIKRDNPHMVSYEIQKGKWEKQEEDECCGDGRNAAPGSYENIKKFQNSLKEGDAEGYGDTEESTAKRSTKPEVQFLSTFVSWNHSFLLSRQVDFEMRMCDENNVM